MKFRKLAMILAVAMGVSLVGCGSSTAKPAETKAPETQAAEAADGTEAAAPAEIDYPTKDIQGSIMWSAGGVCDTVSRAIGSIAQQKLGTNIIFTNRAGSGGGVSTAYVNAQAADGYELLFGAENPQIAKVMGTSDIDYEAFTPINLCATTYGAVCVGKDSPYQTLEDLVNDVLANPGKVIMATTGAGGLPETVAAMMNDINGTEPNMVAFDGENECMTNLMGGNAAYSITTLGSAASFYESGDIRILAMIHNDKVPGYEEVPAITETYPDYEKYLPWGPFYGVFVKNGTDEAIVAKLTEVFQAANAEQEFQDIVKAKGCFPLDLSGDEAKAYLEQYRATTSWLLFNSGVATTSPEEFGIAKP